jgi:creatinine amidohydrolase/Fe(II)-dependent formamide hydrolase-like protein
MTNSLQHGMGVLVRALLRLLLLGFAAWAAALGAAAPARAAVVQLEELTWTELQERVKAGTTTVLVPLGGTEQNGPHMALGKHNARVRVLAGRIAERLGNAVVAPVLAYVPEGSVEPPAQHMRWPGTISISEAAFEATLEGAARSLRKHGLCQVVLLADHGGYRASLDRVAARLNREWAATACRVHALPEYYRAAAADYAAALKAQGYSAAEIGTHAGLADTALTLATAPQLVRSLDVARTIKNDGVAGDPRRATAELGRPGVEHIVDATVAAIHAATHKTAP